MSKSINPFVEWINSQGIDAVSKRLKIGRATVSNWLAGRANPRLIQMREIKKITKGAVTYEDIIERPTTSGHSSKG